MAAIIPKFSERVDYIQKFQKSKKFFKKVEFFVKIFQKFPENTLKYRKLRKHFVYKK